MFQQLKQLRVAAELSPAQVETKLLLGPGWVTRFEAGELEPPLGMLAALLGLYGTDIPTFFAGLNLGKGPLVPDRHLTASQSGDGLQIYFPMGSDDAAVTIPKATLAQLNEVVGKLRDELAAGRKKEAIAVAFLDAVHKWPHYNPSDLWYFLISHDTKTVTIIRHPKPERFGVELESSKWMGAGSCHSAALRNVACKAWNMA